MKAIVSGMATRIRKGAQVHVYIKEWMDHLRVSDDQMAGRLNLASRSSVWKLYKEQHRLDLNRVKQIADALGMDGYQQLFRPPPTREDDPDSVSLDAILEKADSEQRALAIDLVRRVIGRR